MVERVLSTPPGKTAVNELDEERLAAAHYAGKSTSHIVGLVG